MTKRKSKTGTSSQRGRAIKQEEVIEPNGEEVVVEEIVSSSNPPRVAPVDDDDEILQEVDVFLSPSLADNMYLLQYPLQSRQEGVDQTQQFMQSFSSARIKPKHGILEIEQPLPAGIEGSDPGMSKSPFTAALNNRRRLVSQTIPVQTHMCLGKWISHPAGGGHAPSLHLVPLGHISQMRPSFRHVDQVDRQYPSNQDGTFDSSDPRHPPTDPHAAMMMDKKPLVFQRKESERAANARKSSYAFKKASEDSEEWRSLAVHSERSGLLKQVACPRPNQRVLQKTWAGNDSDNPQTLYVNSLNYISPDASDAISAGGPVVDLTNLRPGLVANELESHHIVDHAPTMDLPTLTGKLTTLMLSGCPIPYSLLRMRFSVSTASDKDLLTALSVCAVMVRGNFCLHSKFLTASFPVPLQRARTFILLILQTQESIERRRLDYVYRSKSRQRPYISSDQLLAVLRQVAKKDAATGSWVLKVEDDEKFLATYPEQTGIHNRYWKRQSEKFHEELELYALGPGE